MKLPFIQSEKSKNEVLLVSIEQIEANPYQPRKYFSEEEINQLADSIKNYGVIQPITVRKSGDRFELIAGERRLRASLKLGLKEIPAIIKKFSDQEIAEIALVENLQRKDLNYLEEAQAYCNLIDKFNITQTELAQKVGKSQSTIANKLRLLTLSTEIRKLLLESEITERHARALLKLKDKEKQIKVIKEIKKKKLTVKDTEKYIDKIMKKGNKKNRIITMCYDLRLFTNTLNKTIKEMKTAGLDVEIAKEEVEDYIEFKIRLPKNNLSNANTLISKKG